MGDVPFPDGGLDRHRFEFAGRDDLLRQSQGDGLLLAQVELVRTDALSPFDERNRGQSSRSLKYDDAVR